MEDSAVCAQTVTEGQLIAACRQGDREAFRRLFDIHKDRVYTLALVTLEGDRTAAEDVAQEVFLKLFTRLHQFRQEAEFSTWLYRLVLNACLDECRRRRRLVPLEELPEAALQQEAQTDHVRHERDSEVQAALNELPLEIRMTVLLKYYEDLSYGEMAQALGCSTGTVASRLHRGLKALGRRLSHWRSRTISSEERK